MTKKFFIFLLPIFVVVGGGFFSFLQLSHALGRLPSHLVVQGEERIGAELSFENAKVILAPFPVLQVEKPRLESAMGVFPPFWAERAQFSFRFLPLLFGKIQLLGFQIREGGGALGPISLQHLHFKVRGLGRNKPAPFEGKATFGGEREVLQGKGELSFRNPGENLWTDLGVKGDIKLKGLSLTEGPGKELLNRLPPGLVSGELEGKLHVEKARGTPLVQGRVEVDVKKAPRNASPGFFLSGGGDMIWNFEKQSLEFQQVTLEAPLGRIEGRALFNLETGEIEEASFFGRSIVLEEVIRYFPGFQSTLPLGTGFSGASDFDLSIRGTWDYLSFHGNWDLESAILTYGKVFSKPKDFPLGVRFDLLLKQGSVLSGDLSVRVLGTTIKGSLVGLDLTTRTGELTLLSNKFNLEGWRTLLTPLTDYEMSGSAKVFLNWKGDLTRLGQAQKMTNLTLENVTLLSPAGRGIRGANVLLDMGPLVFRLKDTTLEIGDSPLRIEAEIYNPQGTPQLTLDFLSPRLDLFSFFDHWQEIRAPFFSQPQEVKWRKWERRTKRFLPRSLILEQFVLNLRTRQNKLLLQNLDFQALDGKFHFRGELDWPSDRPKFWVEAGLDRIRLSRYFDGLGQHEEILEGNLFFNGRFEGQGGPSGEISKTLSGRGSLSMTNGEWHSLDLLRAISRLGGRTAGEKPIFESVASYRSGSTPFYDLRANWSYQNGKFDTKDLVLRSEDLWVEGKGDLSLEGILNSRLEIYLSNFLTRKAFESWESRERPGEKQLGPLPLFLVGTITHPELRPDDRALEPFLEAIRDQRYRRVLRHPFKE